MKKYFCILFIILFILTFAACSSKTEAPVMKAEKTVLAESSSAQKLYVNEKLGFTFAIPDSWESENYTTEVTNETMKENKKSIKYTKVTFAFQGDKEYPLLTVLVVPKTWWDSVSKEDATKIPIYLGTKSNTVYCFTLPADSTMDVGAKQDLYNSMVLVHDDVPNHFSLLNNTSVSGGSATKDDISTIEGILKDGAMQSIIIQTDDGRALQFSKNGAEKVNLINGLIVGQRLRIYYKGTITGSDTSKVTVTKLEKLK